MTDNYSQLKITSDANKSFNMTKDDAAVGMLGALVVVKEVGPPTHTLPVYSEAPTHPHRIVVQR